MFLLILSFYLPPSSHFFLLSLPKEIDSSLEVVRTTAGEGECGEWGCRGMHNWICRRLCCGVDWNISPSFYSICLFRLQTLCITLTDAHLPFLPVVSPSSLKVGILFPLDFSARLMPGFMLCRSMCVTLASTAVLFANFKWSDYRGTRLHVWFPWLCALSKKLWRNCNGTLPLILIFFLSSALLILSLFLKLAFHLPTGNFSDFCVHFVGVLFHSKIIHSFHSFIHSFLYIRTCGAAHVCVCARVSRGFIQCLYTRPNRCSFVENKSFIGGIMGFLWSPAAINLQGILFLVKGIRSEDSGLASSHQSALSPPHDDALPAAINSTWSTGQVLQCHL